MADTRCYERMFVHEEISPFETSVVRLKHQAKDPLREFRAGSQQAIARFREHHPRATGRAPVMLSDAEFVVAREYGFATWPKLKLHVELLTKVAAFGNSKPSLRRVTGKRNCVRRTRRFDLKITIPTQHRSPRRTHGCAKSEMGSGVSARKGSDSERFLSALLCIRSCLTQNEWRRQ